MALPNVIRIRDVLKQFAPQRNDALTFEEFTTALCDEFSGQRSDEKRGLERVELPPIPAEVQPLGNDLESEGEPFAVILRNISARGIGLMFGKPVDRQFLEIRVSLPNRPELKTIIEVTHCTENGFMIGGTSLTDLEVV